MTINILCEYIKEKKTSVIYHSYPPYVYLVIKVQKEKRSNYITVFDFVSTQEINMKMIFISLFGMLQILGKV